jgi:6-pyruvoyl tetrahydropterin synthase/QueD family protein
LPHFVEVVKEFTFEAAHILPKHPGKCSRLHGHSWKLRVGVSGPINLETGMVVDYVDLKSLVNTLIVERLDHSFLGCGRATLNVGKEGSVTTYRSAFGDSFYPTSENLVIEIARVLQPEIIKLPGLRKEQGPHETPYLSLVALNETCTSEAVWRP